MTKIQWLRGIPRSDSLTLEDALHAADIVLSEAESIADEEAWRRNGLVRAVQSLEELASGLETNLDRGVQRFADLAMARLRAVLVDRGFALFDEVDAAEKGLGAGDPLVWTPKAVRAELDRVRGVLETVNAEAKQAAADNRISADELELWTKGVYHPGIAFVSSASTFWGSNAIAAREHEQNAGKWRAFLQNKGAALKGPGDLVRKEVVNWEIPLLLVGIGVLLLGIKWKG